MERFDNVETTIQETNEAEIEFEPQTSLKYKLNSYTKLKRYNSKDMKKDLTRGLNLRLEKREDACVNCKQIINKFTGKARGCFFHSKKWNGVEFECCGEKNKFSPGCIETAHLTENESKKKGVCSNCKRVGHECKVCPWDPNARTGEDPVEELRRISTLQSYKNDRKVHSVRRFKVKEDSFADITILKNSVVREKMYLPRDINETKDSSIHFKGKLNKIL